VSSIIQNRRASGFTCVTGMLQAAQAAGRLSAPRSFNCYVGAARLAVPRDESPVTKAESPLRDRSHTECPPLYTRDMLA
jgi:hypothetical protein